MTNTEAANIELPVSNAGFRTPTSTKDAKSQLRRLRKTLKKYKVDRADAFEHDYTWGVKAADEKIPELEAAIAHFEDWVKRNR